MVDLLGDDKVFSSSLGESRGGIISTVSETSASITFIFEGVEVRLLAFCGGVLWLFFFRGSSYVVLLLL